MKALACIVLDNRNAAERSDAQKLQTFEFVLILVVLTKVMLAINALINVSKEKLRIIWKPLLMRCLIILASSRMPSAK